MPLATFISSMDEEPPQKILVLHVSADSQFAISLSREISEIQSFDVIRLTLDSWNSDGKSISELLDGITGTALTILLISKEFLESSFPRELIDIVSENTRLFREHLLPVSIDRTQLPLSLAMLASVDIASGEVFESENVKMVMAAIFRFFNRSKVTIKERKEVQARVEARIDEYVVPVLEDLNSRASRYQWIAYICYSFSLVVLACGFRYAWVKALESPSSSITWPPIVQHLIASIILIALLGAVARLAFVLGKSFMVESLRNTDRIHAISYGRFYLQAFGEKAQWIEVKEAFQHWNIDKGSSFMSQEASDIDPQVIQLLKEFASGGLEKIRQLKAHPKSE